MRQTLIAVYILSGFGDEGGLQAKTILQGKAWRGEVSAGRVQVAGEQLSKAEREPERKTG